MKELREHCQTFVKQILFSLVCLFAFASCAPKTTGASSSGSTYLYVASGMCYSSPNTTFTGTTASNVVYRISTSTGQRDMLLADYTASPAVTGDTPVGLVNIDDNAIQILVENATTAAVRRIEHVDKKDHGARITFSNNTTVLSAALRSMIRLASGDLLISRTTGVEYLTTGNARVGSPYYNPSAAPCASTNTGNGKIIPLANGYVALLNAPGAANNRVVTLPAASATACTSIQNAPDTTNAYPTAAIYDATNSKLIVAFSGNTTALNTIYAYPVSASGVLSTGVKIYDASLTAQFPYLLYGISEMALDSANGTIYIATAVNTSTTVSNYAIEKFTYTPAQIGVDNTKVLARVGTTPFYPYGIDTKCISTMMISN